MRFLTIRKWRPPELKGNRLSKQAISFIATVHNSLSVTSVAGLVCGKLKKLSKRAVWRLRTLCMFSRQASTIVLTNPNEVVVEHWEAETAPVPYRQINLV